MATKFGAELKQKMDTLLFLRRDIVHHLQETPRYHYSFDEIAFHAVNIIQEYNFHYDLPALNEQLTNLYSHIEMCLGDDVDSLFTESKEIAQSLMSSVCSEPYIPEFLSYELLEQFFDKTVSKRPAQITKAREESKFYIIDEMYPDIRKSLWWQNSQKNHQALLTKNKKLKLQRNILLLLFVSICAACVFLASTSNGPATSRQESEPLETVDKQPTAQYVGSVHSKLFHRLNCINAQKIAPENRVYYDTIQDAIEDGRKKCSVCFGEKSNSTSTNNSQTSNKGLYSISPPKNGEILYENGDERVAPFTVETKGSGYYYIKLKDTSGNEVLRFFVHGGETAEVEVPLGEYSLYYASGNTWYGSLSLFGSETLYKKATDLFDFYVDEDDGSVCGWTVELYLQANGNLGSVPISANEF